MDDLAAWLQGLPSPVAAPKVAEVQNTAEFRRICDMERADPLADPNLPETARLLTWHHKTAAGEQTLRTIQAAVLQALYEHGSVFAPVRTGGGKTLISFIAPELIGALRPLLVVPAKLINSGKTHRDHKAARLHWKIRPILSADRARSRRLTADHEMAPLRVISYESLGRVDYADALIDWAPDLILLDEAHKCKDLKSAVTRRLGRYVRANHPRVIAMSGSPTNRKLADYAHILRWCLGDAVPVPRDFHEVRIWGWALDEKVSDGVRVAPGHLLGLSPPEPGEDATIDLNGELTPVYTPLTLARRRYARRFVSTPGIVASGGDLPALGLLASVVQLTPDAPMRAAAEHLRAKWETPCGLPFEMATELWRHEREVSCGFYYRWDEQPHHTWLTARRAWSSFVREVLAHSRTYDSPLAVANAIDAGKVDDHGALNNWRAVAHLFNPEEHKEPVWISDQTVNYCAEWLARERGIAWVSHIAFGERLSQVSGVPYFSAGGMCKSGVSIDVHEGPAIASVRAINEGFNLQTLHSKNLVVPPPTTNMENEQMISRTHREGQTQDEVEVIYLTTLEGDARALSQARADAAYVEQTTRQRQRLEIATWLDN